MKMLVSGAVAVLVFSLASGAQAATYSLPIDISNQNQDLADYQVQVTVDTKAMIQRNELQSQCEDIRFIDADGVTSLPYWIESGCNDVETIIWVKIPHLAALDTTTIAMEYGDPSLASESNASAVFDFYEGFDGTALDSSRWTLELNQGFNYDVSNGQLNIYMNGFPGRLIQFSGTYPLDHDLVIEAKSYISDTIGNSGQVGHLLHWHEGTLLTAYPGVGRGSYQGVLYPRGQEIIASGIYDADTGQAKVCYNGNCTDYYQTAAMYTPSNTVLGIGAYDHSYDFDPADRYSIDWIRVRKFANTAPAVTQGSMSGADSTEAIQEAYDRGYTAGFAAGEEAGHFAGYNEGYAAGQASAQEGCAAGKQESYTAGYQEAVAACQADPASCGIAAKPGKGHGVINPGNGGWPPAKHKNPWWRWWHSRNDRHSD